VSTEVAIKRFIIANFATDVSPEELDSGLDLLDAGVVDSLGLLRLVAWVSDSYDIPVDDLDISPEDFSSVDSIRAFVETARTRKAS
jgi:acyl carrier protein